MNDHLSTGQAIITPAGSLKGKIRVPGDKSISHRAVMFASLAQGTSRIKGFLKSEDCIATLEAFRKMGVKSEENEDLLLIHGQGTNGLQEPIDILDMGNSGTGTRLILGILAGQNFSATLTGDSSLRSRPMQRVVNPLRQMGAEFIGREEGNKLPLSVKGGHLNGINYTTPVASAQIKSAILLAGLFADGITTVNESGPSRDHTERMLRAFGAEVITEERMHHIEGGQSLTARDVEVPADISSAAFFMVAALIVPGSDIVLEAVGLNPTRTGILDVLLEMGADITLMNQRLNGDEPVADIHVKHSELQGIHITGDTVVRMIDEFPIFAVAAACATSTSIVDGAEELRVKETDRISAMVTELGRMGVKMDEKPDGFQVEGGQLLTGAKCQSYGDHRIAMSMAVAALKAKGNTTIHGTAPIATSFPDFFDLLEILIPGSMELSYESK